MHRFKTLFVLLGLIVPVGVSLSGCGKHSVVNFCQGSSGIQVGQVVSVTLQPQFYGKSLSYGQTDTFTGPAAIDCQGNAQTPTFKYSSSNTNIIDINPVTGAICAGTWNRNNGNGVPDYSFCTQTNITGTSNITASGGGATSNPVTVYVHEPIASIVVGSPSVDGSGATTCNGNSPGTDCCSITNGQVATQNPNGSPIGPYDPNTCLSQNFSAQIVARVYDAAGTNITCSTTTSTITVQGFPVAGSTALLLAAASPSLNQGEIVSAVVAGTPPTIYITPNTTTFASVNGVNTVLSLPATTSGPTIQVGATTTANSTTVTLAGANPSIIQGAPISGPGISAGTTITSVNNATLTISLPATASATPTLTIALPVQLSVIIRPSVVGHPSFTAVTAGLVNFDQNGVATAVQPGSTVVTATFSKSTSVSGFYATCPPVSLTITTPNASNGVVNVRPGTAEPITYTALDQFTHPLTGLALTYVSSTPRTVSVNSSTGINAAFPSEAAITAFCEPPGCNSSPFEYIGRFPDSTVFPSGSPNSSNGSPANGKPIGSNTIIANANGLNSTLLWMASTQSLFITPIDFTRETVISPVRLPFQPNSMIISEDGAFIYLGSTTGLMTFNASTNTLSSTNNAIQGTALAASPNNLQVVVADSSRNTTYLIPSAEGTSGGVTVTFNGVATAASFSPDSQTLYLVTSTNQLLVYSGLTGTTSYDMSGIAAKDVSVAVPQVGAFVGGTAGMIFRSYCANSSVFPVTDFYPVAGTVTSGPSPIDQHINVTNDEHHALGASATGGSIHFDDVNFTFPPEAIACPAGAGPTFDLTNTPTTIPVIAQSVTSLPIASDSSVAFVTYQPVAGAPTTGTVLPAYKPAASGAGTVTSVTLANGATAPVFGTFSSDNSSFYVGTAGDNLVHIISVPTLTDTEQINPQLQINPDVVPGGTGNAVPDLLVQRPRSTT